MMVRDFQSVIGREARAQMLDADRRAAGRRRRLRRRRLQRDRHLLPLLGDASVELDRRRGGRARHRKRRARGVALRGQIGRPARRRARMCLQDEYGQVQEAHSISAGLDYPGVGPEHAYLKETGRAALRRHHRRRGAGGVPDALPQRRDHSRPGVIARHRPRAPLAPSAGTGRTILVNLSGRGDKDLQTAADALGMYAVTATGALPADGYRRVNCRRAASRRLRARPRRGPHGDHPVCHRRLSDAGAIGGMAPGHGPRRRGPDRDRRPFLRSAGRRRHRPAHQSGRRCDMASPWPTLSRWRDGCASSTAFRSRSCSWATSTRCCNTGSSELARDSAAAGVDGYIVPDLPAEESDELLAAVAGTGSISSSSWRRHRPTSASRPSPSAPAGSSIASR